MDENKSNTQAGPPQPTATSQTPANSGQENAYGGFVVRAAANMFDFFLLSLIFVIIGAVINSQTVQRLGALIYLLFYAPLGTGLYATTLGKRFFYLKIVKADGGAPSVGTGYLRDTLGRLIASLPLSLGLFWVAFDEKKQGWHDKIAKTYVVQTAPIGSGKKFLAYFLIALPLLPFTVIVILAILLLSGNLEL